MPLTDAEQELSDEFDAEIQEELEWEETYKIVKKWEAEHKKLEGDRDGHLRCKHCGAGVCICETSYGYMAHCMENPEYMRINGYDCPNCYGETTIHNLPWLQVADKWEELNTT